jgi:hypothetical protein
LLLGGFSVEKVLLNQVAETSAFISVTPQILRDIATKLELQEKNALPGEAITIKFTPRITLSYQPLLSVSKFLSRNNGTVDLTEPINTLTSKNAAI